MTGTNVKGEVIGKWKEFGDEYDRIIAWKNIPEKKIADKLGWLKKHHNELKVAFNYDVEVNYDYFEIAESLTECLCEYPYFYGMNMFVI